MFLEFHKIRKVVLRLSKNKVKMSLHENEDLLGTLTYVKLNIKNKTKWACVDADLNYLFDKYPNVDYSHVLNMGSEELKKMQA